METLELGELICSVKRSYRRTVCIRVGKDGTAEILAPTRISLKKIKELMLPYSDKISVQCERQRLRNTQRESFFLDYGSKVRFLGREAEIRDGMGHDVGIDGDTVYLPPSLSREEIRQSMIDVYKISAREYLTKRTAELSEAAGIFPNAVKINSATSHWASMSRKNSLNFSWFCIMADPEAIDYIIIHELCHMKEFNHSPRFWKMVSVYCPDYNKHRKYLKELWCRVLSENWEK